MRSIHLIGLILWRGGLLLVATTLLVEGARTVMRLFEIPVQLEIGFGLFITGLLVVIISLIVERVQTVRAEGDLSE